MPDFVRIRDKKTGNHYTVSEVALRDVPKENYTISRESALDKDGSPRPPKYRKPLSPAAGRSSASKANAAGNDEEK